jgi:hypothetical protein
MCKKLIRCFYTTLALNGAVKCPDCLRDFSSQITWNINIFFLLAEKGLTPTLSPEKGRPPHSFIPRLKRSILPLNPPYIPLWYESVYKSPYDSMYDLRTKQMGIIFFIQTKLQLSVYTFQEKSIPNSFAIRTQNRTCRWPLTVSAIHYAYHKWGTFLEDVYMECNLFVLHNFHIYWACNVSTTCLSACSSRSVKTVTFCKTFFTFIIFCSIDSKVMSVRRRRQPSCKTQSPNLSSVASSLIFAVERVPISQITWVTSSGYNS